PAVTAVAPVPRSDATLRAVVVGLSGRGVDTVEYRGHFGEAVGRRVEACTLGERHGPGRACAAAPGVGRGAQALARSAAVMRGFEVVEAAADVAQGYRAGGAVEAGFDHGLLPSMKAPGAGQANVGAAGEIEAGDGVVLDFGRAGRERLSVGIKARGDSFDGGEIEHPQGEIGEMDAEVDHAAAAREGAVVEPGLVGPIGVVEGQIDCEDLAK